MQMKSWRLIVVVVAVWVVSGCSHSVSQRTQVNGRNIRIEFNGMLQSRVVAKFEAREIAIGDFAPSETVTVAGKEIRDFALRDVKRGSVQDAMGVGQRVTLT
ncbi:MAG TPA: hypothetical protein VMW51_05395, partial [Terriglobia bacterium]|nr:hypothetical protein [Terriglobia bacterium]